MSEDRWQLAKRIYNSALERETDRREGYLTEACGGDVELRKEVEALLAYQGEAEGFMKAPAMDVAAQVMAKDQGTAGVGSLVDRSVAHYRIVEKVGEGGMGVVYRAQDTRLGRSVAIKSLPDFVAQDPGQLSRFEREAKILAALNHPNIASIHGLEESDGKHFLVLELVEGKTLAERLRKGSIPLGESLEICRQIAVGLEAAHEKGIIHRDLKPSNIKITPEGKVKILDFGLARAMHKDSEPGTLSELSESTDTLTEPGAIVGTAAYMSPEQAVGKPLDRRTDIWAFGCILFECLTGKRVFRGESTSETLAAVIKDQPAWNELPHSTPVKVRDLLKHCLQQDADRRLHHIADARIELEECQSKATEPEPRDKTPRRRRTLAFAAVFAATIMLGVAGWLLWRATRPTQVGPLRVIPLTTYPGLQYWPSFSPDGSQVAFVWNGARQDNFDIYVTMVRGGPPRRLTTDPAPDYGPSWSPDGGQIAFLRGGFVYLISPLGPPERKLTHAISVSWAPDGKSLVISDQEPGQVALSLYLVSLATTERQKITAPPEDSFGDSVGRLSPDGKNLAFVRLFPGSGSDIYIQPLAQGLPRGTAWRLTNDSLVIRGFAWTADGRAIVFSSDRGSRRSLWRIAARPGAEPERVPGTEDAEDPTIFRGPTSHLAYARRIIDTNIWCTEIPAPGAEANPAARIIDSTQIDVAPQFSPDGSRIAFCSYRSGFGEIWVADSRGSNAMQLTSFAGPEAAVPRWSPDGRRIAFNGIVGDNRDIFVVGAEGGGLRRLTTEPSYDARPSWSRDGRWIYFRSNRSGSEQIWKMPSEGGNAVQVTKGGAMEAFESPDSKLLYYAKSWGPEGIWSVPVDGGQETCLIAGARPNVWAVADRGIYFADVDAAPNGPVPLLLYRFEDRRISRAAVLEKVGYLGNPSLSVTRDGRWVAWVQVDRDESTIMLIDNFR